MEQVIVSIAGLILVAVLYQERARRADMAALRRDMDAGFVALREGFRGELAALRDELKGDMAALRDELKGDDAGLRRGMDSGFAALRRELKEEMSRGFARIDRRIDDLTTSVFALAESVGLVKGRTEVLTTADR